MQNPSGLLVLILILGFVTSVIYGSSDYGTHARIWTRVIALALFAGAILLWEYERGWPWLGDLSIGPSMFRWFLIFALGVFVGSIFWGIDERHNERMRNAGSP